jgi:transcription elongation factor GreA
MEKVPMTAEGYRTLDDQLKQLKSVERPSVIAAISEAREHGDLSENAEYHAAKERQGWIEGRSPTSRTRSAAPRLSTCPSCRRSR